MQPEIHSSDQRHRGFVYSFPTREDAEGLDREQVGEDETGGKRLKGTFNKDHDNEMKWFWRVIFCHLVSNVNFGLHAPVHPSMEWQVTEISARTLVATRRRSQRSWTPEHPDSSQTKWLLLDEMR